MSERNKRCQYMDCCWKPTGSVCSHVVGSITSAVCCLGRLLRNLTRRRRREYVRDDRAGVELMSVQQLNRPPSVYVRPSPTQFQVAVIGDGPRELRPFHRSWYPNYPTLLAISKALDELENTQKSAEKEKEQDRTDGDDKSEELPKYETAENSVSTSLKEKQNVSEQQYDWDVWSVESLEWNFDDDDTARSVSSPSFG